MGLVFFRRWGLLDTRRRGREGGFCHSQWTAFAAWARRAEVTGRSAVGAEASASALLVDTDRMQALGASGREDLLLVLSAAS